MREEGREWKDLSGHHSACNVYATTLKFPYCAGASVHQKMDCGRRHENGGGRDVVDENEVRKCSELVPWESLGGEESLRAIWTGAELEGPGAPGRVQKHHRIKSGERPCRKR